MLPLKYMQKNPLLAKAILENWDHDTDGLDEAFQSCRISANAVCPFPCGGKTRFLRFAPEQEKGEQNWRAEFAFLEYLQKNGFPCSRPVPSKNGRLMESVASDSGAYLAAVFEQAPGTRLDQVPPSEEMIRKVGAALGRLHRLSSSFRPVEKPWGYSSVLGWCIQELKELEDQEDAVWEATQLTDALDAVHRTKDCFGLVHFDFRPDNLFLGEDGQITVIDFEDCMLNWYACDLDIAVSGLKDWLDSFLGSPEQGDARLAFLNGYRTQFLTPGHMWAHLPKFRRFSRLYRYTRIVRAIGEPVEGESAEAAALRGKLEAEAADIAMHFQSAETFEENNRPED